MVEYYGSMTQLGSCKYFNFRCKDSTVQPWEKAILNDVAKGILHANIGLNPQSNGEMLIISVPPLTEERRIELVKRAKSESDMQRLVFETIESSYGHG